MKGVELMPLAQREEPLPFYLDYVQVERLYGLSRTTTWRAIRDGQLEATRVGRSVRISRETLDRFMQERTVAKS
jgi:excisionase family DNA binding protein